MGFREGTKPRVNSALAPAGRLPRDFGDNKHESGGEELPRGFGLSGHSPQTTEILPKKLKSPKQPSETRFIPAEPCHCSSPALLQPQRCSTSTLARTDPPAQHCFSYRTHHPCDELCAFSAPRSAPPLLAPPRGLRVPSPPRGQLLTQENGTNITT